MELVKLLVFRPIHLKRKGKGQNNIMHIMRERGAGAVAGTIIPLPPLDRPVRALRKLSRTLRSMHLTMETSSKTSIRLD